MNKKLSTILLVDDNEHDNMFHEIVIKEMDCTDNLEIVKTGATALEYLRKTEKAPDLILLDINMPLMTGWEFLEHYDQLSPAKRARALIVMLSTDLNHHDLERAEENVHVNSFMTKPLTAPSLTSMISEFI